MYDDMFEEVGVFDFDELANHLLEQGLEASPSLLHGCLSGVLAAGAPLQAEFGLDALCQSLDLVLHGELAGRVMQLYTVTAAALQDDEFTFHPLLPEDDEDIAERTEAMANWCKGFLAGFAQMSAAADKLGGLSQDSSEVLTDIAAMAQAAVDDGGEEGAEESSEESYMELVEYLRFAVLNVFTESQASSPDRKPPPDGEPPLH